MVGGGGKIGGPAGLTSAGITPGQQQPSEQIAKKTSAPLPADHFDSSAPKPQVDRGPGGTAPVAMGQELSASTNLLQLARQDPVAARQLVATLASQAATALSEVEQEMAAARLMLEKLAQERFAKSSLKKAGKKLSEQRARLAALKRRLSMGQRKMALLQQAAGKLDDPRLDQELDRILTHHRKLKTNWGKRHHLLSLAASLYDCNDTTPEHLREAVTAEVRTGGRSVELGDTLHTISPRRVISELMARTLDGSVAGDGENNQAAERGEYGRSMQSYSILSEVLEEALKSDPFSKS